MLSNLETFRTNLHQIPEVGFHEFKTKTYILDQIKDLKCTVHEAGETGLVLYFDFKREQTIAFRTDMDALPISEKTNLSYSSRHAGVMHACGHDGHMAIILGLAHHLDQLDNLDKNIVLIFQPSEEKNAGAHVIMNSLLLKKFQVEAIFGLHLWPGLPKGEVYSKSLELMAQGSEVNITIKGKAAHVANYQDGIDTLQIACRYLTDLYNMEQQLAPEIKRLLKFGVIHSGTARNIISDTTKINGTLRSYDPKIHQYLKQQLTHTAQAYMDDYHCEFEIEYNDGYDAVVNDSKLFSRVCNSVPYIKTLEKPVMQSEDFGVYGKVYPSVFFFLGIGNTPPLHNEKFDFDMTVLDKGLQLFLDILASY